MEFTSRDKERIQHQFDAYCTKTLKYAARTIYRQRARLAEHEISLSELPENGANLFSFVDDFITDAQNFSVLGYDIAIKSELLSEAVRLLPEARRNIILLYYFLGMNDREIGEALGLIRSNVQYHRTSALKLLQIILEELRYEEL